MYWCGNDREEIFTLPSLQSVKLSWITVNLQWNSNSFTCAWIVVLTPKWQMMPRGIWNGPSIFTPITSVFTRARQAWTYFPFLLYNLNKELHYSSGIFQTLMRPYLPEAAPMGDISTRWIITPARQASVLRLLHNNKHNTGWDPRHNRACREEVLCLMAARLKADGGDKADLSR